MRKKIIVALTLLIYFKNLLAQTPTWSGDVACIVYSHCSKCHNSNGIAPFSLMDYNEVYNSRQAILNAIQTEKMPPYLPDTKYQHYADERKLTSDEIKTIANWVSAGAPKGDINHAPAPPVFTHTEEIVNPDLSVSMPNYTIPAVDDDLYRCFVLTGKNVDARFISEIEVVPGNRSVVHHVLVFQDTSNIPVILDNADPDAGYTNFGGIGSNTASLITAWVPGSNAYKFPLGMGVKLLPNARIVIQVHYPRGSSGQKDATKINIKFSKDNNLRDVRIDPVLEHFVSITDGPLSVPPGTVKTFHEQFFIPVNATVLGVAPHAHLLCKKMKSYAVTPLRDTIDLIKIDDWDFHWQGFHPFKKLIKIPAGSMLYGEATYDNTVNNPENPNNPPKLVNVGEATTDEMMLFYFAYMLYQPGDENIVVDATDHEAHYNNCTVSVLNNPDTQNDFLLYPNPARNVLKINSGVVFNKVEIFDNIGKKINTITLGNGVSSASVNIINLSAGSYIIKIKYDDSLIKTKKFIKIG